ncbi:MAG: Protein translocase subunit SecE, partial [uncultured Sphingomonas sp.]
GQDVSRRVHPPGPRGSAQGGVADGQGDLGDGGDGVYHDCAACRLLLRRRQLLLRDRPVPPRPPRL